MADPSLEPWSGNPNAPNIPLPLYILEKANFAGIFVGATFYGIVVILFFQCMGALFRPASHKKRSVKWALAVHTTVMFSLVTITIAMGFDVQSIAYINDRSFPGVSDSLPPGPVGYQYLLYPKAISVIPNITFLFGNLLADGLLLYRCYIIYAKNRWAVSLPCLMYLSCLVLGIILVYYQSSTAGSDIWDSIVNDLGTPYYFISLSLNVLLTFMIVTRLILHGRNIRDAMGESAGLYKSIITMIAESSSIYAITFLLFIGPWAAESWVSVIFYPILVETQNRSSHRFSLLCELPTAAH